MTVTISPLKRYPLFTFLKGVTFSYWIFFLSWLFVYLMVDDLCRVTPGGLHYTVSVLTYF